MKNYRVVRSISACLALAGIIILACRATREDEHGEKPVASEQSPELVRVITLNAQLLPSIGAYFNKYPDAEHRARRIAQAVSAYDIIGLCEIFHSERRQHILTSIKEGWGSQFHCVLPDEKAASVFGIGSGLVLVSRYPILESHSIKFGNDSPVTGDHGIFADGFAAKGIIHARVAIKLQSGASALDCFLTHLESADSKRREAQYAILASFISRHSDGTTPVLLMGDLNTRGDAADVANSMSQYHRLLSRLRWARPSWLDLGLLNPGQPAGTSNPELTGGGERIDYLLLSNPPERPFFKPVTVQVLRLPDDRTRFLSDHCAVEAELTSSPW